MEWVSRAASVLLGSLFTGAALPEATWDALRSPQRLEEVAVELEQQPMALALRVRAAHLPAGGEALARQTLDVIAPLADRLGLARERARLEDESFARLDPLGAARLAAELPAVPPLASLLARASRALEQAGLTATWSSREKSLWSLHQKALRKGVDPRQVHDRLALRGLLPDEASCYAALDELHRQFPHLEGEVDDYIRHPKASGYQSLHTVLEIDGALVEVQLRTPAMHAAAEQGGAAHWRYKLATPKTV